VAAVTVAARLVQFEGFVMVMFTIGVATTLFAGTELDFSEIKGRTPGLGVMVPVFREGGSRLR
jgi:hypothetical protein